MEFLLDLDWAVVGGVSLGLLELILRLKPTKKSWSLLVNLVKLLEVVVPDRKKE